METNREIFNRKNNGSECKFKSVYSFTRSQLEIIKDLGYPTFVSPKKDVESFWISDEDTMYKKLLNIGHGLSIDLDNKKLYYILDYVYKYGVSVYEITEVSSIYWQTDEGVYRLSFHWGTVGKSKWYISQGDFYVGYANWKDFTFFSEIETINEYSICDKILIEGIECICVIASGLKCCNCVLSNSDCTKYECRAKYRKDGNDVKFIKKQKQIY